jgi:SAM-dependent methyltransferase
MIGEALDEYFRIAQEYNTLYLEYQERGYSNVLDTADKEFVQAESWKFEHYFDVGADALRLIVGALVGMRKQPPSSILDFPCGSGRVTRHLRSFFPDAAIVACDLYDYHTQFCEREFDATGVLSKEDIDSLDFGKTFDLIFCGSLLTHLPVDLFIKAIDKIIASLSSSGVAIITLHGRRSLHIQKYLWKYVDDDLFKLAASGFSETGFGYVDYDAPFKERFDKQSQYGVSLSKPSWVMQLLEQREDITVSSYVEKGWDNHQDVLVIEKIDDVNVKLP